jgi:two-component system alkaline phosphatase synthesis response regulator PhoP
MADREKPLILIADDDKDFLEAASLHLRAAGFDTVLARDGNEAVKKTKESQPDLVLMDIRMPGGPSGVEAALGLKEIPETKKIRIVFLSGLDNPWPAMIGEKSEVSKEMGMEDFIVKTGDFGELAEKVKRILGIK